VLPGRPDPEPSHDNAVMERAPLVLPALAHVLDLDDVEADRRLVGVHRERAVELLDALGEDVEEQRELRLAADDDVALHLVQRNALLSLSKKPSCLSYVRSSACSSNSRSSRRCSSFSCRGTSTLTRIRSSPRPKPWRTGMPRPRRTTTSPGCAPASSSSSSS